MIDNISISILYETNAGDSHLLLLTNQEYYDVDESSVVNIGSSPKYNHAYSYIGIDKKLIKSTKLNISRGNQYIYIYEAFWNDGENHFIEVNYNLEKEAFHELIIQSKLSDSPLTYEIIRFNRNNDVTLPIFHVIQKEFAEETEEIRIYPTVAMQ